MSNIDSRTVPHDGNNLQRIAADVSGMQIVMVNLFFVGTRDAWVLVDTGLAGSAGRIEKMADKLYGPGARPEAIVLTHGHFDHIGAVRTLAEKWDVPVYAHRLELPYLTGRSAYPPPDPTVGGGAMAFLSFLYPKAPIDLGQRIRELPEDHSLPGMPGWQWIHTPGHTPGHVALFRKSDGVLIAGDAFVSTRQESMMAVMSQKVEVNGPPKYFTPDWERAAESVRRLAELRPSVAATGHGQPIVGDYLQRELQKLALEFETLALPRTGRYLVTPARADESGVVALPPPVSDPAPWIVGGIAIVAIGAIALLIADSDE